MVKETKWIIFCCLLSTWKISCYQSLNIDPKKIIDSIDPNNVMCKYKGNKHFVSDGAGWCICNSANGFTENLINPNKCICADQSKIIDSTNTAEVIRKCNAKICLLLNNFYIFIINFIWIIY